MGILVPSDFPLSSLKNDEERMVVNTLCDQLTDGWLVLPGIKLETRHRPHEMDVVILHPSDGIAVIEVKGHRPHVVGGAWIADGRRMDPQPLEQAQDNAFALRDLLREVHPDLTHLEVEYGVAFPNIAVAPDQLPAAIDPAQVLTCSDLETARNAIGLLMTFRYGQHPLGDDGIEAIVRRLRPDVEFRFEPEARARLARLKLETISDQQVRALETLDLNRQVCVTGAAGTGKTRLATAWARRALLRNERVLLTCFNIPLAARLRERLVLSPELRIGEFHGITLQLDGLPPLEVPDDADQDWWEGTAMAHRRRYWPDVTERFDTIIIDEAQDFDPAWIEMLTQLFRPDGPRRLLMVADETQKVYRRGFEVPDPTDGWVRCELTSNCRNSVRIADLLRRQFGAGSAPIGGPETEDITWIAATDQDGLVEATGVAIDAIESRHHGAETVLVCTFTGAVRDALIDAFGFARWEQYEPGAILCENVHRIKGLEYDHVVLVAHQDDVRDELLYVGASRAVLSLTVIGPPAVAQRLGVLSRS